MTNKNIFYYIVAIFIIVIVGMFLLGRSQLSTTNPSLDKIRMKAKAIAYSVSKNINTLKIKSNVYDEEGELIVSVEILTRLPNRMKVNMINFQNNQINTFIANKDKYWMNKPFLPLDAFISQFLYILAGEPSVGKVLEEESGIQKLEGRQSFVVSFLFDKCKIRGYLEYSSFTWLKIEAFILYQENWLKIVEIYPQKIENIKGMMIPRESMVYLYSPDGKQIKQKAKLYMVETNIDLEDNIFKIPQEN